MVFSPVYYKHDPGRGHPESGRRLGAIVNELKQGQLSKSTNWRFIPPEKAHIEEAAMVHDIEYIRCVKALCKSGGGLLDSGDTMVSPDSFEVAMYALGGTLKAVRLVMQRQFENAFALVRPPGHHAGRFYGLGFCIFNNIAAAAQYLLECFRLQRILILDIDAHHGNGTQEIFYETDRVLYVSLHEDPRGFPGTGFLDQVGEGKGRGYKVNVPLPFRSADRIYLKAIREIVIPIARQYQPQFMLVSAGLDCHYADPVGHLSLSALCYDKIYETIISLASQTCNGRLVMALEGGYNVRCVGMLAAEAIAKMGGSLYRVDDKISASSKKGREKGEEAIKDAKKVQRNYWNLG